MSTGNRGRRITVLLGVAALWASLLAGPAIARNENGASSSREVQLRSWRSMTSTGTSTRSLVRLVAPEVHRISPPTSVNGRPRSATR